MSLIVQKFGGTSVANAENIKRVLTIVTEKAKSRAQQKFMAMVHDAQKGEKPASKAVADVAASMKKGDVTDFAKTSYEGVKKFGLAVSQGEWSNILTLLSQGVKYLLRKLKDAMYSNIGMIVDGILIATGVGKGVQWIPWALITALDIYQLMGY